MVVFTYLALGDSYTIGEQVPLHESFPYQAIQLLRKTDLAETQGGPGNKHVYAAPEILAKTGWTTGELAEAIGNHIFLPRYDMVTLLIGVNNQYRGLSLEDFKTEFSLLLQMALQFAGGLSENVYVLSIPDWGQTPFASGRDISNITKEINEYNIACARIAATMNIHFINITGDQRADSSSPGFLAADNLHPSGKEYTKWAVKLAEAILSRNS